MEEISAGRPGAPVVPEPTEAVGTASELRPVIEAGDILCFSGAHLHTSVPNTTGVARFSVEVRTADAGDAAAGRGAPNLDGEAPRVASGWFRHVAPWHTSARGRRREVRRRAGIAARVRRRDAV